MPDPAAPLSLPVHPHQLEVQEFDAYALIVDLRDEAEYAVDHVLGAINMPWTRDASAPIRMSSASSPASPATSDARPIGLPQALNAELGRLAPTSAVLVYCDLGGLHSGAVAAELARRGFAADVLPGGWGNYRRWVAASIDVLASVLTFRWVRSPPGGASQVVIDALAASGAQALNTASMLYQQVVPGLSLGVDPRCSQASFDTRLVDALRRLDPARPVWIDETLATASPALPVTLLDALRRSEALLIAAPLDERVTWLANHLRERGADVRSIVIAVDELARSLRRPPGIAESMAIGTDEQGALRSLLHDTIDPLHAQLASPSPPAHAHRVELPALSLEAATNAIQAVVSLLL